MEDRQKITNCPSLLLLCCFLYQQITFGAWTDFIWEHPKSRRVTANWLGARILQSNLPFSPGPKCFKKLQVGESETEYANCNDDIGDLWTGMTSRKLFTEAPIIETTKMMFTIEDVFGLNWKYKFLRGSPFGDMLRCNLQEKSTCLDNLKDKILKINPIYSEKLHNLSKFWLNDLNPTSNISFFSKKRLKAYQGCSHNQSNTWLQDRTHQEGK